ncbi:MAG: hypothetical protein EP344_14825, partial [Bacteroidetes bacterium]
MKTRFFTVLLTWCTALPFLQGQTDTLPPLGGIILDDSIYARTGEVRAVVRSSAAGSAKSLLPKTAFQPFNQRCELSCGSCAVTMAVMMRLKIRCDARCNCESPQRVFSWSYLHNLLVKKLGPNNIHLTKVLDLLKVRGIPLAKVFRNTPCSHILIPDSTVQAEAGIYGFWTYEPIFIPKRLFSGTQEEAERQFRAQMTPRTIAWIDQDVPVIIGMSVSESFRSLKADSCRWIPPAVLNTKLGHALLVTGYDDQRQEFQLLNSYGTNWGCDGVMYISYADYERVVKEGYVL